MKVRCRNKFAEQMKKVNWLAIQLREESRTFDNMVHEKYGVSYSDVDADYIIDSLDYGHSTLTVVRFHKEMKDAIKRNKPVCAEGNQ